MATATKTSGYGNIPGPKTATKTGSKSNVPGIKAPYGAPAPGAVPTFTPSMPTGASFAAAQAGQAPELSGGGSGGGVAGDPRDPTYWTDVAKIKNTFDTSNQSYDLQQQQGQTQLNTQLAALDRQQPIDASNQKGSYNNSGLLYSSRLTGAQGELTHQYDTNRTSARGGYGNLVDQLNILRKQNKNQYGEGGTAYLDALNAGVGRSTDADRAAAANNSLVGMPAAASGAGAPNGLSADGKTFTSDIMDPNTVAAINKWINLPYQQASVPGGVLHIYPDGRKILVKK